RSVAEGSPMRLFRRRADPVAAARARLESHEWPAPLLDSLARLREGGHASYLVGGTVRDVVLGRSTGTVFDVSTDLHPDEVSRRFERVEPIGIAHGTVLIVRDGLQLECTTFRREGAYADAR